MMLRICAALLLAFSLVCSPTLAQMPGGSGSVTGQVLETSAGLPIAGAEVQLRQAGAEVAKTTTTTTANGSFSFSSVAAGTYAVLIAANGYQTAYIRGLVVNSGRATQFRTALSPLKGGLKEIYSTTVSSQAALQTSATINNSISPALIQDQNYVRAGDALSTLPFVTAGTSSSLGDDETLSIRGFDPTETLTLLDGHPIGPIGAQGAGYDYQLGQFWGFSNITTIYGSGATGLYSAPTIAGAVDFETISPTPQDHYTLEGGYGDLGHSLTAFSATGTDGHVGYAFAYGMENTDGELGPENVLQTGLLGEGAAASGCPGPNDTNGLPTLRAVDEQACDYQLSGAYQMRNIVGKINYQFDPKTALTLTVYNATMYADSTGNGDTDYLSSPYVLYTHPSGANDTETLPSGASVTCTNSYVVLNDSSAGYTCLNSQQFAADFSGPQGGGLGRFHSAVNGDYHARFSRRLGAGTLVLDGFVDNYDYVNVKGPPPAPAHDDTYVTHGGLISDEFAGSLNDLAFGIYWQNQTHFTNQWSGNATGLGPPFLGLNLTDTNYFIRDTYAPNERLSFFADLGMDHSYNTSSDNFDPRLAIVWHATNNDVVRVAAGRSTSVPDPSILTGGFQFSAVDTSFNATASCHTLTSIGGGNSPNVQPERDNDLELGLAHRFEDNATIEADAYDSIETNPILGGIFPLSIVPASQLPGQSLENGYLTQLDAACGATYTDANLGVSSAFNAGQAIYRGLDLTTKIPITRQFSIDGGYVTQVAYYNGLSNDILSNNTNLINGSQFPGVPLHQASVGASFNSRPGQWSASIENYYTGAPNPYARPAYWYANGNVSKTVGPVTFSLGIYNIFNQNSSPWGLIGLGTPVAQNSYGIAAGNNTAFEQGAEEYALPPRQIWLTTTIKF